MTLKVVHDMGAAEAKKSGAAAVARMKAMPTDDDAFGPGLIREERGASCSPPICSRWSRRRKLGYRPGGRYKLLFTTPADEAARPLDKGGCPFIHT